MGREDVDHLVALLGHASRILIFTGAGISTSTGIPDFRGPGGVWTRRQPVYYQDFMRSEKDRIEHWDYKLEGYRAHRDVRPTAVHEAIVRLETNGWVRMVVTQNVDGLHRRAGTPEARLVELHGTDAEVECQSCGERTEPAPHFDKFERTRTPPTCHCGGLLKTATISFGQNLRSDDLERALSATGECDLVVALGSTLSVYPAADIPLAAAREGVPYAIINQGDTDHDKRPELTLRLEGDVQELFPPAVEAALAR